MDPTIEQVTEAATRFWSKVDKSGDCWLWTGAKTKFGYGQIRIGGAQFPAVYAHRVSYQLIHGPIPAGMSICHRCDTPGCVNPTHLFLGTQADNIRDAVAKQRMRHGPAPGSAKLTEAKVREIRERHARGEASIKRMAREYGVWPSTVRDVLRRNTWKHL